MSKPLTVEQYLIALPPDRRATIEALREVINANIDPAFEEGLQYGMLAWFLPHSRYPAGYHADPKEPLPFASIGSMKNHIGLYLFCVYGNQDAESQFRGEWQATGKKLDMGSSCVRIKKLDDVALPVLGRAFARMTATKFVAHYEASKPAPARRATRTSAQNTKRKEPASTEAGMKKKVAKQGTTAKKKASAAKA